MRHDLLVHRPSCHRATTVLLVSTASFYALRSVECMYWSCHNAVFCCRPTTALVHAMQTGCVWRLMNGRSREMLSHLHPRPRKGGCVAAKTTVEAPYTQPTDFVCVHWNIHVKCGGAVRRPSSASAGASPSQNTTTTTSILAPARHAGAGVLRVGVLKLLRGLFKGSGASGITHL